MIPPSSPSPPPENGGSRWVRTNTPTPAVSSSRPTAEDQTDTDPGSGNSNSPSSPPPPAWTSPSVITHPEPANGTRSNTDSSLESPTTGAEDRWKHTKPSSTSSLTPQPPQA